MVSGENYWPAINDKTVTSDAIGNMLSDGTWTYTWEHGRELASMSSGGTTWNFTYDANGMRTQRTDGTTTYSYVYNGGQLSQMKVGETTLNFTYDASGTPLSVNYNGTYYYYVTDLQGDVVAIVDTAGVKVVEYLYDAWGRLLETSGTKATDLGVHNPLRYRGYVYDPETGLYYLQSRYYNPTLGRFINSDCYGATGQGLLGNNTFVYCANNPTNCIDTDGRKVVGIGVQVELQLGDVGIGVEFILYFDETVCGGEDYLLVMYTYSGYEVPIQELSSLTNKVEALLLGYLTENTELCGDIFIGAVDSFLSGIGASGGAFWIDGNENFVSPDDYQGSFETLSLSIELGGVTTTGFHSYSDTCDVFGAKVGRKKPGLLQPPQLPFGLGFSYSRTDYSAPTVLLKW